MKNTEPYQGDYQQDLKDYIEKNELERKTTEDKARLDYLRQKAKRLEPMVQEVEEPTKEMAETLSEGKKFIFQLVSHEDGHRSNPFMAEYSELTTKLAEDEHLDREDFLLLVMILDGKETIIPGAPLIKISTLIGERTDV